MPKTGGVFTVTIWSPRPSAGAEASGDGTVTTEEMILWDRKRDGGFPGMLIHPALIIYL